MAVRLNLVLGKLQERGFDETRAIEAEEGTQELSLEAAKLVDYLLVDFVIGAYSATVVFDHFKIGESLIIDNNRSSLSASINWKQTLFTFASLNYFLAILLISLRTYFGIYLQQLLNIKPVSIILA